MANKRRGAYSTSMNMPGASVNASGRGAFTLLLCLLLPPLGLMFMWRKGVFKPRGRIFLSLLVTLEMALILSMMMPESTASTVQPVIESPKRYTESTDTGALSALSNIDELLNPNAQTQISAEMQAILDTTVYVHNGEDARYYHSQTVCGTQSNFLTMTVQDALSAGLSPCPDCDPPVYSAAG